MTKRLKKPKKTVGYGYSGMWHDGQSGWFLPLFIHPRDIRRNPSPPNSRLSTYQFDENRTTYLCKITVEPVLDKLGRPITKRVKKEERR